MNDIFDQLLKKRGITEDFLSPKYRLDLADKLPDIRKASERIIQAVNKKETVLIYGDYDVDGVTASTLMYDCLKMSGILNIEVMLPDRFIDGYGMGGRVKERAKEVGANLIITVDCGSNNAEVIDELSKQGVDVIVTDHHEIMKEEIFGPVLPIIEYEDIDKVIRIIKAHEKPLACYVFTRDKYIAKHIIKSISYGCGCINDVILQVSNHYMPFGGVGSSGMGSYHGKFGFDTFSHKKSIVWSETMIDLPIRYAPFNQLKFRILKKILESFNDSKK